LFHKKETAVSLQITFDMDDSKYAGYQGAQRWNHWNCNCNLKENDLMKIYLFMMCMCTSSKGI